MRSLVIFALTLAWVIATNLKTVYEWKWIDYQWEKECDKQLAIDKGQYDHKKLIPFDVHAYKDTRVWITIPKFRYSNPASLTTVSDKFCEGGPLLRPYPSWEWHVEGNCSGITNAMKVAIDGCGRMWVVDAGKIGNKTMCPAQILAFDLKTDRLLHRYKIPKGVVRDGQLVICEVETHGAHCEKTWVYAADSTGTGFVIFDGSKMWRLESNVFEPDHCYTTFTVANESVKINGGPIGLIVTGKDNANDGIASLWSLSSGQSYAMSARDLHNSKDSQCDIKWYHSSRQFPSQMFSIAVSKNDEVFFGFVSESNVCCFSLGNSTTMPCIIELVQDEKRLQFVTSMKIVDDGCGNEKLWAISNRFQKWARGTMNFHEINFRVMSANVDALINGTTCRVSPTRPPVTFEEAAFCPMKNPNH